MQYRIITEDDRHELERSVNGAIADGWIPQGGVSVSGWFSVWENDRKGYTETETNLVFAQAMTKPSESGGADK